MTATLEGHFENPGAQLRREAAAPILTTACMIVTAPTRPDAAPGGPAGSAGADD
jgi:hypothetical protein